MAIMGTFVPFNQVHNPQPPSVSKRAEDATNEAKDTVIKPGFLHCVWYSLD